MRIVISKGKSSQETLYRASFESSCDDEYYSLFNLLSFSSLYKYSRDPIISVKELKNSAIKKIKSLGITSTPLADIIDELANNKIKEFETKGSISLITSLSKNKNGDVEYRICQDIINVRKSTFYTNSTTTDGEFSEVRNMPIEIICGRGKTKNEALDNLITTMEEYEKILSEYINDVRELCERVKE